MSERPGVLMVGSVLWAEWFVEYSSPGQNLGTAGAGQGSLLHKPERLPATPLLIPKGEALSASRVREWRLRRRLGISVSSPFPRECLTSLHPILVSIPCHLEPDVRFALIRLSDNLLPGVFKTSIVPALHNLPRQAKPLHFRLLALKYSLR